MKIHPPKGDKIKLIVDNNPSPGHYKTEESYASTQLRENAFLISKTKVLSLAEKTIREKKDVPAVGHYNTENIYIKTTRGAARGWK